MGWGALAGVAQWIERWPANWKVASLIPCQGMCLGCGPGLQLWARERQVIHVSLIHRFFSSSFSLLTLKITNKIFKKKKEKEIKNGMWRKEPKGKSGVLH